MQISVEQMKRMHGIQVEMLIQLISVMNKLNIKYYFVHGSLLGAIRQSDFIAEDDDIDIAIFRSDYNLLMKKGNDYLKKPLFLQSPYSDRYPLPFAKLRNSDTAFIQPAIIRYGCNMGVYIDIFPIDYEPKEDYSFYTQLSMVNTRINHGLFLQKKCSKKDWFKAYFGNSLKSVIYSVLGYIKYPTMEKALIERERLFTNIEKSKFVTIFGGKNTEKHIPVQWFGDGIKADFCGIDVFCPIEYGKYLKLIYGEDYINHNPADKYIHENGLIEVSASIVSFEESYQHLL